MKKEHERGKKTRKERWSFSGTEEKRDTARSRQRDREKERIRREFRGQEECVWPGLCTSLLVGRCTGMCSFSSLRQFNEHPELYFCGTVQRPAQAVLQHVGLF